MKFPRLAPRRRGDRPDRPDRLVAAPLLRDPRQDLTLEIVEGLSIDSSALEASVDTTETVCPPNPNASRAGPRITLS
jgi:hypothetical protein